MVLIIVLNSLHHRSNFLLSHNLKSNQVKNSIKSQHAGHTSYHASTSHRVTLQVSLALTSTLHHTQGTASLSQLRVGDSKHRLVLGVRVQVLCSLFNKVERPVDQLEGHLCNCG